MKDLIQRVDRPPVRRAIQVALGLLLLWAAISKIGNPTHFLGDVLAYRIPFPRGFLNLVAAVLPWVELLVGLLLLADAWLEAALSLAFGLFGVFFLATAQAWFRGLSISCGCFDLKLLGFSAESGLVHFLESPGFAFFRNLFLLGVIAWLHARHGVQESFTAESQTKSFKNKALDIGEVSDKKVEGKTRRR